MKHSPLPWVESFWKELETAVRDILKRNKGNSYKEEEAISNVRFIVKACNMHYELVEALKEADGWFDALPSKMISEQMDLAWQKIQQAIAKATEGENIEDNPNHHKEDCSCEYCEEGRKAEGRE